MGVAAGEVTRAATVHQVTAVVEEEGAILTEVALRMIGQVRQFSQFKTCFFARISLNFFVSGYDRAGPSTGAYDSRGSGGPVRSYESRGPDSRERARPY